jgi:hypothetical protein
MLRILIMMLLVLHLSCKNDVNKKSLKINENNQKKQINDNSDNPSIFLNILLKKFIEKKISNNEVRNSKNYEKFRKTKYFKMFLLITSRFNRGIVPNNKDEILKHLFSIGDVYQIIDDPSPGSFKFNRDGTFKKTPGQFYGRFYAGEWIIDNNLKKIILIEKGIVAVVGYAVNVLKMNNIAKLEKYKKDKDLVWLKKYKKPIIERISFKDIQFKKYFFHYSNLYEYSLFGNTEKNKIINGKIGKYINNYDEIE